MQNTNNRSLEKIVIEKLKKYHGKRLKLIKNKLIGNLEKRLDIKGEIKEKYSIFNLDEFSSVLALFISNFEQKEYVVEKMCYISTYKGYTTNDNYYMPVYTYDALIIINKKYLQLGKQYYDYYLDELLENGNALMISKSNNAKSISDNPIGYNGYYDGQEKLLQFNDKYNISGNGIISVRKDNFEKFENVYKLIEYIIDKRDKYKLVDLSMKDTVKLVDHFLRDNPSLKWKNNEKNK